MKKYPSAKPSITNAEKKYVLEVLDSGVLSMGEKQEKFEKKFAATIGVKYAAAVSSGTAGLHLSLIAAGIGKGDEVITTPFSFVASANAILYVGAEPVFVDIEDTAFNIDPSKIEAAITKRTRAILVVHIFGQSADMGPILRIAKKHSLKIIEDACESVGATYRKNHVGTFGESAVFAFYPNKQMTTGEGGMVTTNSRRVYELIKSLRNQGRAASRVWLDHERLGYNYRLDELSCAVGLAQVERIGVLLRERQRIAALYVKHLDAHTDVLTTPKVLAGNTHTWFVYVVRLKNARYRNTLIKRLEERGVSTKPYLPSIHLLRFYRKAFGYREGNFPVSERVSSSTLALPFYIDLTESDIEDISKKLVEEIHTFHRI
ncbi:MAG: DegT/DnrJ/EryC1/StrS family aminotransferase [Patescibacteria group bacterium]|mgnify:CR=1 FL=1